MQGIAVRHEVRPNQVSAWKRQAVDGLDEIFANGKGSPRQSDQEATIRNLRAKIGGLTPTQTGVAARARRRAAPIHRPQHQTPQRGSRVHAGELRAHALQPTAVGADRADKNLHEPGPAAPPPATAPTPLAVYGPRPTGRCDHANRLRGRGRERPDPLR